jgi:hypothetical protein
MTTVRMSIRIPPELERRLAALALANTGGNRTAMINSLINRAYIYPAAFSLISPHEAGITDEMIDDSIRHQK